MDLVDSLHLRIKVYSGLLKVNDIIAKSFNNIHIMKAR